MDSIFRLDSKGNVVFNSAARKLVPQFEALNEKQMKYLVLAYDMANTVFKQLPKKEWRNRACMSAFGHEDPDSEEKKKALHQALPFFKILVYDEDREMKQMFQERKRYLLAEMLKDENIKEMKVYTDAIKQLDNKIKELDSKITSNDEIVMMASKGQRLSVLEMYQRKMKESLK